MGLNWLEYCEMYRAKGYSAIPVWGKRPLVKDWSQFCERIPTDNDFDTMEEACKTLGPPSGFGLCLGRGLVALDLDIPLGDLFGEKIIRKLQAFIPKSPATKLGKVGLTAFYRGNLPSFSIPICKHDVKDFAVELLSVGKQTVMPPSPHPDGLDYAWAKGKKTLLDLDISELPRLPDDLEALIREAVEPFRNEMAIPETSGGGRHNKHVSMMAAMIRKGFSDEMITEEVLKHDKGGYWTDKDEHRRKSPEQAVKYHLDKLKATLERDGVKPEPIVVASEPKKHVEASQDLLCDGFISEIADELKEMSPVDSPLSFACGALALGSHALANRYGFSDNLTNNYYLLLGKPGSGKSAPLKGVVRLLEAAGYADTHSGNFGSDVALLLNLSIMGGTLLWIKDEAQGLFTTMSGDNPAMQNMEPTLNELFSIGQCRFSPKRNASKQAVKIEDIYWPHLTLVGMTTVRMFQKNLRQDNVSSGLSARMLPFVINGGTSPRQNFRITPSRHLVEALRSIQVIKPRDGYTEARFDPQAEKLRCELLHTYFNQAQEMEEGVEQDLTTRKLLRIIKFCLIKNGLDYAVTRKFSMITRETMEWAVRLDDFLVKAYGPVAKAALSYTSWDEQCRKTFNVILKHGPMTKPKLKAFRKQSKTIEDELQHLIEIQAVGHEEKIHPKSLEKSTVYSCTVSDYDQI